MATNIGYHVSRSYRYEIGRIALEACALAALIFGANPLPCAGQSTRPDATPTAAELTPAPTATPTTTDPFASLRDRFDAFGRQLDRYGRPIDSSGQVTDKFGQKRDSETAEIIDKYERGEIGEDENSSTWKVVYLFSRIAFLIFCIYMVFKSFTRRSCAGGPPAGRK